MAELTARSYRLKPRTIALLDALRDKILPGATLNATQTMEAVVEAMAKVHKIELPPTEPRRKTKK